MVNALFNASHHLFYILMTQVPLIVTYKKRISTDVNLGFNLGFTVYSAVLSWQMIFMSFQYLFIKNAPLLDI